MAINEKIAFNDFSAVDVGGSMVVHTFGAYFGSVAWPVLLSTQMGFRIRANISLLSSMLLDVGWLSLG